MVRATDHKEVRPAPDGAVSQEEGSSDNTGELVPCTYSGRG